MSLTYFQASADSASDLSEPGCEPLLSVKSTPTAEQYLLDIGQASPSSETSENSAPRRWPTPLAGDATSAGRGANSIGGERLSKAVLTSSAEASPARTSALPERVLVLQAREVDSGANTTDSFGNFDPATSSWRTSQRCLVEGWQQYSETWPRSGMTRNGIAYRLPTLARLTGETESGLWPTTDSGVFGLTVDLEKNEARRRRIMAQGINGNGFGIPLAVSKGKSASRPGLTPLDIAVRPEMAKHAERAKARRQNWPTPASRDHRHPNAKSYLERGGGSKGEQLPNAFGGALNPTWVEWLMGYPLGWTVLEPSAMPSSRRSRK